MALYADAEAGLEAWWVLSGAVIANLRETC